MPRNRLEVGTFASLFTVEPTGGDEFTAVVPITDGPRAFGGHLLGLALRAATETFEDSRAALHSVHARFVRAAAPERRVCCHVERLRDGRTFTLRRVSVAQDGRTSLQVELSFHHVPEASAPTDGQRQSPVLRVPPATLPTPMATATPLAPFEVRAEHAHVRGGPARLHPYWARLHEPLLDDPVLHACALAILTDVGVSGSARRPGRPLRIQRNAVSLDHALSLHRPFRADDWMRVDAVAESNAAGRGFARGTVVTTDGTLVASFGQEVLLGPS